MRIWSIHPRYLDTKGLVALWRETLLAQYVLDGKTKGYKNHPQLDRFKKMEKPSEAINAYLAEVFREAERRGYTFSREKIDWNFSPVRMSVTQGQMEYETEHFLRKLAVRDPIRHTEIISEKIETHPLFEIIPGEREYWEIVGE